LYEWYVSYEEIREILFAEIKGSPEAEFHVDRNISMLVAGCGNSSLCEDLSRDGIYCNLFYGNDSGQAIIMFGRVLQCLGCRL
jgi:hypothetical protein